MEIAPEILATFRIELEEKIQLITEILLKLEEGLGKKAHQRALDEAFRAAHTIKGSAQSLGADVIAVMAHHLESVFGALKQKNRKPPSAWIELCLEARERMLEAMDAFERDEPSRFNLQNLLSRMNRAVAQGPVPPSPPSLEPPETAPRNAQNPSEDSEEGSSEAAAGGEELVVETIVERAGRPEPPKVKKTGVKAGRAKGLIEVVQVTADKVDQLGALAESLQVTKLEIDDHFAGIQRLRSQVEPFARTWERTAPTLERERRNQLPPDLLRLFTSSANQAASFRNELARIQQEMSATISRLGTLSSTLGNDVRMLRLVSAATVLRPLTLNVRDMARELDKKVNLEISGQEVELERGVLQKLRDPLIHLLRNAIDHGIESPEQRLAAGKPEAGKLAIRVRSEGKRIEIKVEDDGAGISAETVAKVALDKGLISQAALESLGREEIVELVFLPGFSSRKTISRVSGRGVGLDVVHTSLKALKGSCQLETVEGKGTTFTLHVPLTLAAEDGLLVQAAGQVFAIPITSVSRIIELDRDGLIEVEASLAVAFEDHIVPLRSLARSLALEEAGSELNGDRLAIVVSSGTHVVALSVEQVVGEREIVVKPLRPPLVSVRNIRGGTVTGSGAIILVLNPSELVTSALAKGRLETDTPRKENKMQKAPLHTMVVDDSITTRNLLRAVLENKGYEVTVAVDGKEAWELMQTVPRLDALVTDVDMPVMDGFELTERVKKSKKFSELPVVIVTSLGSDSDKKRGIEVGADAYIVKGDFETTALLEALDQLV